MLVSANCSQKKESQVTPLWLDEESESDTTKVMLQGLIIDNYIEALLAQWGMD